MVDNDRFSTVWPWLVLEKYPLNLGKDATGGYPQITQCIMSNLI